MSSIIIFTIIIILIVIGTWWVYDRYQHYERLDGTKVFKVEDENIPSSETIFTFDINPASNGVVFFSAKDSFAIYIKDDNIYFRIQNNTSSYPIKLYEWVNVKIPKTQYSELYIGGIPRGVQDASLPNDPFIGELRNIKMNGKILSETLIVDN